MIQDFIKLVETQWPLFADYQGEFQALVKNLPISELKCYSTLSNDIGFSKPLSLSGRGVWGEGMYQMDELSLCNVFSGLGQFCNCPKSALMRIQPLL